MSSPTRRQRRQCTDEDCGSTRFHVAEDGYTYCDRGHQQSELGAVVTVDAGELVLQGARSRKQTSDAESIASGASTYSGSQALEHYLLCVQLILRKQLYWLVQVQKLPEELEAVVKDLWSLRLQKLRNRVSYESDHETGTRSSQVFSSQSESDPVTDSHSVNSRRSKARDSQSKEQPPNLIETLSLCYIGALLLRVPLNVGDVHKWTNAGELLYYRAPREVPLGMRERLPGLYHELLEPQEILSSMKLHESILEILAMLDSEFGMAAPPINISLVLYRWVEALALPLEIFTATQRLARILDVDGKFNTSSSYVVLRYPEPRLMALLVIATKLLLPFDDLERRRELTTDLPTLSIEWSEWVKIQENPVGTANNHSPLDFDKAFSFAESDCMDATPDTLDSYLDWYGDNIANEEVRERGRAGQDAEFRKALFRIFPTSSATSSTYAERHTQIGMASRAEERLRKVMSTARAQPVADADNPPPPGSFYRRYRHAEDLFGPVQVFFEKAAELAGVSEERMVQAVFLTERKLQKYEENLRKAANET